MSSTLSFLDQFNAPSTEGGKRLSIYTPKHTHVGDSTLLTLLLSNPTDVFNKLKAHNPEATNATNRAALEVPVAGPSRPRPDTLVVFRKVDPDWTPDTTQWTWDSSWPNQKHLSGEEWMNVGRNARKEWFDEEEDDGVNWELYGDGEHLHNGVHAHFVPGIIPLRFFLH
ncbi:predicted protein [Postia placenta Mad-698-R]|nr:predicted protein [Postia placenta Mad-698-R]